MEELLFLYLIVEESGEWRIFHNKKLCCLCSSFSEIKDRWSSHVPKMEEASNLYRIFV